MRLDGATKKGTCPICKGEGCYFHAHAECYIACDCPAGVVWNRRRLSRERKELLWSARNRMLATLKDYVAHGVISKSEAAKVCAKVKSLIPVGKEKR